MTVNDMSEEEYWKYYDSLCEIVQELTKYYDIDKTKMYAVYVWNKADSLDNQWNVFDIHSNKIIMYDEEHEIIEEAKPIIKRIQDKLKEFDKYLGD
ncbi:MAG: hypothetical protein IKL65_00200 [Bacilli bacterium]|nr:hypothetical protein [Bacilli bacterium]